MNIDQGAGRYAPSPSGDLHLGNLRTAVAVYLFARATGRRFFVRIDDLDRARDAGVAASQLQDLAALGMHPDVPPSRQTQYLDVYERYLQELQEAGLVFECFCSRKDILEAPRAPHEQFGHYPGTCRNLSTAETRAKLAELGGRKPALRLAVPHELKVISFEDGVQGETTAPVDEFVLRRGDGIFAYNFATAIDDATTGIDQVVRGRDLILSASRQIAVQKILGLSSPYYYHVPLVLGPEGSRLAKRDGAVTLAELRAAGVSPWMVLEWILASLGADASALQKMPIADALLEAAKTFDARNLGREDVVVNPAKLWGWGV